MELRRGDIFHLGLMFAALSLAYVLPFELLLIAYIVLGPAHYYTEISWLHDRSYFMPTRAFAAVLAAAALGGMFMATPYWSGILLWCCFTAAAIAALGLPIRSSIMLGVIVGAVTLLAVVSDAPFAFIGILLPTFIHVSIFTLIFMTLGAMRSGSRVQFGLIGVYIAAVAAILIVPPSTASTVPSLAKLGKDYFGDIAPTLGSLFGAPDLQFAGRVTGLLSFVYTYHYLNWFIKADVIRWARIPRPRLAAIVVLSVASTAFCFYDYTLGITVLLLVSLLHVLLEFPLNSLAIRDLAGLILSHPQRGARPVRT